MERTQEQEKRMMGKCAAKERCYGEEGFMMLVPGPQDLVTGEPGQSAIATVDIKKYD